MDIALIAIGVAVWWTFAVIAFVVFVTVLEETWSITSCATILAMAVFWPITVLLMVPVSIYNASVASAKRIRTDLRNRKVLNEFEEWLRTRNKD